MNNSSSLRDYQRTLSARLLNPQSAPAAIWLGIESGGHSWLLDLADVGETLPRPPLHPVPLTQPWLLGVTNIRGDLHTLIDLGLFAGQAAATVTDQSRVVLVAARHRMFCGFLVDRVSGLFRADQFLEPVSGRTEQNWLQTVEHAETRESWLRPGIPGLLRTTAFLNIAI